MYRYLENTSWMFGEQILRLISGLLVGIWMARYLGPERFGIYSYVIAFTAIFSGIAKLGLDGIVVRDLVQDKSKTLRILGTAFWLKLFGAVLTVGLVGVACYFTSNDYITNIYILVIASGTVFQSFEVIDFYFQSQTLSKFSAICKVFQTLFSTLMKLYFLLTEAEIVWFVLVSIFDQITLAISFYIVSRHKNLNGFYRHFDPITARQLMKNSWPLMFSSLVVMIYMRIDQIMIKEMLGQRDVGLYSAIIRLSEIWYAIPVVITNSLFPAVVSAKKIGSNLYYTRLQRLYTFLVWTAIAVAIPIAIFSDVLVTFLYGEAYRDASHVLVIHIWTVVFVSLGVASSSWFTCENLQHYALYRTLLGAVVNIFLNLILIPTFGLTGAAISTLVAQAAAALFFDVFTKKTRVVFMMKLRTLYFSNLIKGH